MPGGKCRNSVCHPLAGPSRAGVCLLKSDSLKGQNRVIDTVAFGAELLNVEVEVHRVGSR